MSLFEGKGLTEHKASSEVKELFNRNVERINPFARMDNRYIDRAEKMEFADSHNPECNWSGKPGDSLARPNQDSPEGRVAFEKLSEFNQTGVRFQAGEPNFSKCSLASAKIDVTGKHAVDKHRACKEIAKQWDAERPKADGSSYSAQEVKQWAKENNLQLHHDSDMKTVRFVPAEIHGYFKHMGGVAEIKARDEVRNGGRFDD